MNQVKFKKDGLYCKEYDENGNTSKWARAGGPIYIYFQSIVELDKKLTLGDLMNTLIRYEADIDAMFMGCTRGKRLRPYYEEMLQASTNKRTDLSHVEVGWVADYYKADNFNHESELYLGLQVSGISKKSEEATYHSLSRASLNDWKHLKMELHDELIINEFIAGHATETGRTDMHMVTLMEAKKQVTLYDLLSGFLTELTMYGYPEQRMERIMDINNVIEETVDDNSWESTLRHKESELQAALETENYERAAMLKVEIDNIKKFLE